MFADETLCYARGVHVPMLRFIYRLCIDIFVQQRNDMCVWFWRQPDRYSFALPQWEANANGGDSDARALVSIIQMV